MAENNQRPIAKGIQGRAFALFAITMLVGMALMGLTMFAPQVDGDVTEIDNLLLDVTATPDTIFSTSTQTIAIDYTLNSSFDSDLWLDNVTIVLWNSVDDMEWTLYEWNLTTDGLPALENPYNYQYDGSLDAGAYQINVTVDYFNGTEEAGYWQEENTALTLLDGTGMLNTIEADPETVPGTGSVNVSWTVDRDLVDIDEVTMGIFDNNEMAWVDEVMTFDTEVGMGYTMYWSIFDIVDMSAMDYNVSLYVLDSWGYSEMANDTLITVTESAPINTSDLTNFQFDEDEMLTVDLSLLFDDGNGDDLMYYINLSDTGDLMVEMYGDSQINISAAMDWYGEENFTVSVNDGNGNNVSFILYFEVMMVDDELAPAGDMTVSVDEVIGNTTFDPLLLFEDVDGPAFTVTLGYEVVVNETNVTSMVPIYNYTDEGNMTVTIDNVTGEGFAQLLGDFEEGSWEFPVTAWVADVPVLNATATVEVAPVNDVPAPNVESLDLFMNEAQTFNVSALFDDPDSMEFNASVDTNVSYLLVTYDWETYALSINPATNWTGTVDLEFNVTDGVDYAVYTIPVNVVLRSYAISGIVAYTEVTGVETNIANVTLTIGENTVSINETTGAYEILLEEGSYTVVLSIPADLIYDEATEKSGYVVPVIDDITLEGAFTLDITFVWMDFVPTVIPATWSDIDFANVTVDPDGDDFTVIVPVDETKGGYDQINVAFVIVNEEKDDEDDDVVEFAMVFNGTHYTLIVAGDDLDDVKEGKRLYRFEDSDDANNTYTDDALEFEFREKEVEDGLITVIVLIVLIVLVLIALVFIMRKPAEEEYEDEGDEEEEESERVCPSCGEIVEESDATECPECGEELEEE
ncbi:MAG: hypothetical protein KAH57_09465 [Thermoplasmata archaeon]|nr:hypothetical protein [Thermoplasmata archaeon]